MQRGGESAGTGPYPGARRRRRVPFSPAALLALLAAGLPAAAPEPGEPGSRDPAEPARMMHLSGLTMGTTYSVKLVEPPGALDGARLESGIETILVRVDRRMSTWREDSELSRFNRSRSTGWFAVSSETRSLVERALRIAALTGGAFDVTVGPLVDLWGFGPPPRAPGPPSPVRVEEALQRVGYAHLRTRRAPPALRKARPALEIDLSGIAKGYAADRIAERLERAGIRNYLVEIGGEMRAGGHGPRGGPWVIAVERPSEGPRAVHRVLALDDRAVATSGDYRNYFERDGRRYSHTIDPRTGTPVTHGLASATVIHESAAFADAMATALMVLGPGPGYRLAARERLAVLLVAREDGDLVDKHTPAFARYLMQGRAGTTGLRRRSGRAARSLAPPALAVRGELRVELPPRPALQSPR